MATTGSRYALAGQPVVPGLTSYVLERFGADEEVFQEFQEGTRNGKVYSGDIAGQYEQEAEVARKFLAHPLKPVRAWAAAEIEAARAHAAAMAGQQQLSHQFAGELSLVQRVAANCTLHLDQVGENVAYAGSVDQAQQGLMHSPPHRENLLNPAYNVAGFGVVRSGFSLYVAQDFGHSLPAYSPRQAGGLVSGSIARMRREANLPQLQWKDSDTAQNGACSMARADSLKTVSARGSYILRYTTAQPEILPSAAEKAIDDRTLRAFSVGTCYARSNTYPNGVYWVTLVLQ